jgi:hypothetical protein
VVFGALAAARAGGAGADFDVETTIKANAAVQGRTVHFSRAISGEPGAKRLVFARIEHTRIRPYRVLSLHSIELVNYLKDSVRLQGAPRIERLRHFFKHLDDANADIADDAYKAYSKFYAAELAEGAAAFDLVKLRKWILDPKTPPQRRGLFALLLGMAGGPDEKAFLAKLASDPPTALKDNLDGLLGGLAMLDRDRALALALDYLNSPRGDVSSRRSGLNAITFIVTEFPRADAEPIYRRMLAAVDFPDVGDLVVDELRKGSFFSAAPKTLARAESSASQSVSGAVVRFALACPTPEARAFIARLRKTNPQSIVDAEQALRMERDLAPAPPRVDAKYLKRL